jgi:lysophospholipase L1-like esterase
MVFSWVFGILMPAAALAWTSSRRVSFVVGATLAPPVLAILQGAVGILTYRVYFGNAPLPHTPSHGVVVVHPDDKSKASPDIPSQSPQIVSQKSQHQGAPIAGLKLESLRCDCPSGMRESTDYRSFLQKSMQEPPLRLLVVGDSLAIGVGQARSSTPIMPEAIAKTLSKQLGGRIVYWTCHGAPGASTGWLVREIERGVTYLSEQRSNGKGGEDDDLHALKMELESTITYMDESSSDESSAGEAMTSQHDVFVDSGFVGGDTKGWDEDSSRSHQHNCGMGTSLAQWKERLSHHRKRFDDPDVLGPYDVVIVLTGSNDLKSAFFPFLLTGEDAEFRRQARQRGGSYTKELRRLLETLNEKMQQRIQTIVHQVEVASESVREKVEETMEYIAPGSSARLQSSPRAARRLVNPASVEICTDQQIVTSDRKDAARHFPLVVLPGMPSRALPIFRSIPLRWLAIPIVDIMDMHKRNFSKSHPREVLFVPPPSLSDLSQYAEEAGEMWEQRFQENTVLSLRDIKKKDCQRIEGDMRQYYENTKSWINRMPRLFIQPSVYRLFSIDQVHPCDEGYDFWGRYLGNSIAVEMLKLKKSL